LVDFVVKTFRHDFFAQRFLLSKLHTPPCNALRNKCECISSHSSHRQPRLRGKLLPRRKCAPREREARGSRCVALGTTLALGILYRTPIKRPNSGLWYIYIFKMPPDSFHQEIVLWCFWTFHAEKRLKCRKQSRFNYSIFFGKKFRHDSFSKCFVVFLNYPCSKTPKTAIKKSSKRN
jgi:hypothetical protein